MHEIRNMAFRLLSDKFSKPAEIEHPVCHDSLYPGMLHPVWGTIIKFQIMLWRQMDSVLSILICVNSLCPNPCAVINLRISPRLVRRSSSPTAALSFFSQSKTDKTVHLTMGPESKGLPLSKPFIKTLSERETRAPFFIKLKSQLFRHL